MLLYCREWSTKDGEKLLGNTTSEEAVSESNSSSEIPLQDIVRKDAESVNILSENTTVEDSPKSTNLEEAMDIDNDESSSQDCSKSQMEVSPEENRAKQYSKKDNESSISKPNQEGNTDFETQTSKNNTSQSVCSSEQISTDSNLGSAQSKKGELSLNLSSTKASDTGDTTPESFSSFLYWREPLPDINVESDLTPESEVSPGLYGIYAGKVIDTFARTVVLNEEETEEFSTDIITGGGEQIASDINDLKIEDLEDNQETFNTTPSGLC